MAQTGLSAPDRKAVIATARANGWTEAMIDQLLAIQSGTGRSAKSEAGRFQASGEAIGSPTMHDIALRENARHGSERLLRAMASYARNHHPGSDLARLAL